MMNTLTKYDYNNNSFIKRNIEIFTFEIALPIILFWENNPSGLDQLCTGLKKWFPIDLKLEK